MPAPSSFETCVIAIGDVYQEISKLTVPRMERFLGPVRVFSEPHPNPWQFKLDLFEHTNAEHILFIDVDIVLHGWDWAPFEPGKFNAVLSQNLVDFPDILRSIRMYIPQRAPLFNSGFWLAPRGVHDIFQEAKALAQTELQHFPFNFQEETPLNLALHRFEFPTHVLPTKYNNLQHIWKVDQPEPGDTLCMHLLSGTPDEKLKRIQKYCSNWPR